MQKKTFVVRNLVVIIAVFALLGCSYTAPNKDPLSMSRSAYLEALTQFDNAMLSVNGMLKMSPESQRPALKLEFDKYIKPLDRSLESWRIAMNMVNISNAEASQKAFMEAKTALMAFIYSQIAK